MAVHKVTQGRESQPVNIVMPISIGEHYDDFKKFQPANYCVVTFSSIPVEANLLAASQASRQALSRYRNPNVLNLWMYMQDFANYLMPDQVMRFTKEYFNQHLY